MRKLLCNSTRTGMRRLDRIVAYDAGADEVLSSAA